MSKSDEILTREEVADYLKLPLRTVDYLTASGQLPYSRVGRRLVRFSRQRLDQWFRSRENVAFNRGESSGE